MSTLSPATRDKLPAGKFAGPGRSYPIPDKSHAANAKARATQAVKAGRMSSSEKSEIDAKANKVLGEKSGKKSYPLPDSPYGRKGAPESKEPAKEASKKPDAAKPTKKSAPIPGKKIGERLGAGAR